MKTYTDITNDSHNCRNLVFKEKCAKFLKAENHKVEFLIKSWNYGIVIIKTRLKLWVMSKLWDEKLKL